MVDDLPTCCVLDIPASEAATDCPLYGLHECRYTGEPMSRQRRVPTWEYVDEELGHVPAEPGPEPRARHRHSRAEVRAQRHRGERRDVSRACVCTCYLCYRRGGVDGGWWRKRHGVRRPAERRLLATGAADTAAALRCDGEDPEPPEPRDELARLNELCNVMEVD